MDYQFFELSNPEVLKAALHIGETKYYAAMGAVNRQEDDVYRAAIEKEFGEFTEDNARKCSLIVTNDRTKHLLYGGKKLCTVFPPKQERFLSSSAQTKINISVDYKIY